MRSLLGGGTSFLLLALVASASQAEVVSADAGGFTVRNSVTVAVTPAEVYGRFLEVSAWWDPAHTWSGDSGNLSIEPKGGGCFCETLADGGSVQHMEVVYVAPGSMVRMSGGLGPLQDAGVAGALTWTFTPEDGGCLIEFVYNVVGRTEGGFEAWANPVDSVLSLQLQRLADSIESRPEP